MKFSPEQLIQRDCIDFTRVMCPKVLLIASMNGMFLNVKNPGAYIAKMEMLGMKRGDLDLRLHWRPPSRDPETGYVELKAGKNKPTEDQLDIMAKLSALSILHDWTNSLAGYVAILRGWKVPMRGGIYGMLGRIEPIEG